MNQSRFGKALAPIQISAASPQRTVSTMAQLREVEGRLSALQKDYAELHGEIFEAAQIHRRLCAPRMVRYADIEIASEIFAVRHLAGDFFTINDSAEGVVLSLGDICGKGLAAGMWTTHLVGRVNAQAMQTTDPRRIVAEVNRDVCLTGKLAPLASLFVARLDPESGRLDYCSAGHPPAMLLRANGELELLSEGGLLLGVVPNATYVTGSVILLPGDVLLAYSDGVVESRNRLEEEFGVKRLEAQFRQASFVGASAESLLFSVLAAVQDFAETYPLVDDLSLVVIRRENLALNADTPRVKPLHLFF